MLLVGWYRGGMMSVPESSDGEVPLRRAADAPAPVWLQRMSLAVLVCFCFYIGALLAVLPWSPRYWDQNAWLVAHPAMDAVLMRGWVRGLVSGVGLLDVWIGVSELLHYRDFR
jgi:hypothetical protein